MSTILIVDDEPQIRHALVRSTSAVRGYDVVEAPDGEAALERAAADHPDLVLLDLGLPTIDGLSVLEALRRWSDVPVVVLTARDDERTKVRALDAGADDYVTKPFGMGELLARLRATLRRAPNFDEREPVLDTDWFTVDLTNHTASAGQPRQPVSLTRTEWAIVDHLMRNSGRLITYQNLIERVWGHGSDRSTTTAAGAPRQHPPASSNATRTDPSTSSPTRASGCAACRPNLPCSPTRPAGVRAIETS